MGAQCGIQPSRIHNLAQSQLILPLEPDKCELKVDLASRKNKKKRAIKMNHLLIFPPPLPVHYDRQRFFPHRPNTLPLCHSNYI